MKNFYRSERRIHFFTLCFLLSLSSPVLSQIQYNGTPLTVSPSVNNMGNQTPDAFCNNTGNCFDIDISGVVGDEDTSNGIIGPFDGGGCTDISATFTFSSSGNLENGDDLFLCYRVNLTSTYNGADNHNALNNAAADTDCGVDDDANDSNFSNYNTNATIGGVSNCAADWVNVPVDLVVYSGPSALGSDVTFQFRVCADFDNTPGKEISLDRFTINGNGCDFNFSPPLPVELVAFQAKSVNQQVQLSWTSASEINFSRYEVEHSTDGKTFEIIHKEVPASAQDISTMTKYFWMHKAPSKGNNYYRLKMIDQDETFEHSRVVEVSYQDVEKVQVFPNPAGDYFVLQTDAVVEPLNLKLMDMNGKMIKSWEASSIDNNRQFSLSDVPSGMYQLIYTGDQAREVVRLVKQ